MKEPQKEKIMNCVICHGNEIKVMNVKEEYKVDNDIVYVQVKVPVCRNCGERYYDRRTMHYLEEIEQKLSKKRDSLKEIGKVLMYD